MPGEKYEHGTRIKCLVVSVRKGMRGPQITLSRTHPNLVKKLFALEVPEIADGTVEIAAIAREAGHRTKIAVISRTPGVNAKGACIGPMGQRVRNVMSELHGEKIDIVDWSEDPAELVAHALSPARVSSVEIVDAAAKSARVVVPDFQLSLAIGKEGQNARLAARLTGWRIDIRSDEASRRSDAEERRRAPGRLGELGLRAREGHGVGRHARDGQQVRHVVGEVLLQLGAAAGPGSLGSISAARHGKVVVSGSRTRLCPLPGSHRPVGAGQDLHRLSPAGHETRVVAGDRRLGRERPPGRRARSRRHRTRSGSAPAPHRRVSTTSRCGGKPSPVPSGPGSGLSSAPVGDYLDSRAVRP